MWYASRHELKAASLSANCRTGHMTGHMIDHMTWPTVEEEGRSISKNLSSRTAIVIAAGETKYLSSESVYCE